MVNKRKFKIISIITILFVISTLISIKGLTVKANNISLKPNFTITDLKATPDPARVGEDILVSGEIVPEDFETAVKPKEIVLVLDTSGSMNDSVIVNGKKTTKIEELKKAAKLFIETMREIPNLEIGIVAYSTEATINPIESLGEKEVESYDFGRHKVINYKEHSKGLLSNNDSKLIDIIDCLKPLGGTNTGEGIRKAIYMLENGRKNANKTIVLMTDGLPTFYSVEGKDKKEYTKIDESNPKTAGTGSGVDTKSLNYSKKMATTVKNNMYNSYSIGYGLDYNGTEYFKQIHVEMRGLGSTKEITEENGFFSKSDGSITEIFNQIAENIKNSYEIQEVSLNIDFNKSFKLNIGGNEVKVGNIIYNKISENKDTGKTRYHADPVKFSFIVKGSQVGKLQSILDNININFLFDNEKQNINSKVDVKVDIISNDLPSISAKLTSGDRLEEIKKDEEITLTYGITPEDFVYNNTSNSGYIDVVVIVELGKEQGNLDSLKNGIKNKLTDPFQSEKNAKFSFITFNKDETIKKASLKSFENSNNYYHDIRLTVDSFVEGNIFKSSTKDITEALNNAYEELERNSRPTATKNIVIIANNDIKYDKQVTSNINNKGYNIVSLSLEREDSNKNLYKLHADLGGKSDNIFNINNNYNDINNSKMDLLREKLIKFAAAKPYEFKPVINLNLGSNFEPVSGIVRSEEQSKQNIGIVEVPTIIYNLTKNNIYHAEGKTIEIKLKANNLASGSYTFGKQSDNIIRYNSILGNIITTNINTPTITVKQEIKNFSHGLYNGINDGVMEIQENNGQPFVIAPSSTLTFGSSFILKGSKVDLTLNIDNNLIVRDDEIKVYKLVNGELEEVKSAEVSNEGNNRYNISITGLGGNTSGENLLIVYRGTVTEEKQDMKNTITIGNISKDVNMYTTSSSNDSPRLQDLF